jgi:hypothetical protein
MKKRLFQIRRNGWAVTLLAIVPMSLGGQSAKNLAATFSPITTYLAGPDIVLFAEFDGSGQICEGVLEKRVYQTPGANGAGLEMPAALVKSIVDQIAPVAERGRPLSPNFDAASVITGGTYHLKSDYENVSIETIGAISSEDGIQVVKIKWTKRSCALSSSAK